MNWEEITKKSIVSGLFAGAFVASSVLAGLVEEGTILDGAEFFPDGSYLLAETAGQENRDDRQDDRDDRQDDRQDCRQAEGAGDDKRDCKQDARQDRNSDG